jgi:hypothetical protein
VRGDKYPFKKTLKPRRNGCWIEWLSVPFGKNKGVLSTLPFITNLQSCLGLMRFVLMSGKTVLMKSVFGITMIGDLLAIMCR